MGQHQERLRSPDAGIVLASVWLGVGPSTVGMSPGSVYVGSSSGSGYVVSSSGSGWDGPGSTTAIQQRRQEDSLNVC